MIGTRLPSLLQILTRRGTVWQAANVRNWYGQAQCPVEITSATAVWYHTGLPPVPIRWVLVRDPKGKFATRALLCTQLDQNPGQILQWFLWRWQVEVTFQEVRAHLGVETQRQWSPLAIARTTPCLLGLFSVVTLLAHRLARTGELPVRHAAWYRKTLPTFPTLLPSSASNSGSHRISLHPISTITWLKSRAFCFPAYIKLLAMPPDG